MREKNLSGRIDKAGRAQRTPERPRVRHRPLDRWIVYSAEREDDASTSADATSAGWSAIVRGLGQQGANGPIPRRHAHNVRETMEVRFARL